MFKKQYPKTIHVAFSPYTYVRVMVMKSMLYTKQDYDKLLKMQGSEIAAYLENSDYKEDVLALGKEYTGYTLVERALYANIIRSFQKLQKISSPDMNYLIRAYLLRYDVYNLKTILRGKAVGQSTAEIDPLLLPFGVLTKEKLHVFLAQDSLAGVLKKAGFSAASFHDALTFYEKEKSLLALENYLDQEYYHFLFTFFRHLSGEHQLFKEFFQAELDALNIKLLLRVKKTGQQLHNSLFFSGGSCFSVAKLRTLASQDFAHIIKYLQTTSFKPLVATHLRDLEEQNLNVFEIGLDLWLLKKSTLLLHQFPLSVDTLLGYMFAKEIEMRNLRVLVKGKQLGLTEEFLAAQLIVS
ncbi:MAG: ATP synthase A1 subunit C [Nanoarchaeota archaeon]